jgi:CBS domain-containing protein
MRFNTTGRIVHPPACPATSGRFCLRGAAHITGRLEAARLMAEKDVGFIPLVDKEGKAVGTVTDRDIVIHCLARGHDVKQCKLSMHGGNKVVFCKPSDDLARARSLMQENQLQRILVCDDRMKPVGVISLQDLAESEDESSLGRTVQEVKETSSIH